MMKKVVSVLAIIALLISCKTDNKKAENKEQMEETVIDKTPVIALGEFDTKAGDFVNKEVMVQGIVDHVCKHGGKKILLVTDNGRIHVNSETRFDEALMGSEINVAGIVVEDRVDESTCLKMEEDNIKSHSEGISNEELFEAKKKHIQQLRDEMKANNVDHISNYSLKYVSHADVK